VVESWNLTALKEAESMVSSLRNDQVLNGIAIRGKRMIVTGKDWRWFFAS
jgi:glutamine cyclotransferase